MKWQIEYDNDTGPEDDGFWEWWIVNSETSDKSFKCSTEKDAKWLQELLNEHDPNPDITSISVTQHHIDRGQPNTLLYHPLAIALQELSGMNDWVNTEHFTFKGVVYKVPDYLYNYVRFCTVPFKFNLPV